MRFQFSRRALLLASLSGTVLSATPALAQDAPADTGDDDEIVVTAQKREENLQDVPISIQALGTRKLDQLNVANFEDFSKLLPSVSFQSSQPGVTTVYMRGVASGGDGNHSGSLPSVGVYLDEQPVTTIGGTLDVHVYDIARIESLAGPQGTLYGASSQAGTIRIITNKPDTSGFEGRVDGEINTVKSGGVGGKVEGMINAPLSDMAAVRFVGWYQRDSGYIDNVPGTRSFLPTPGGITVNNNAFVEKDFNDAEIYGGRAALKVDLDDNWTITPTVLYQKQKSSGVFVQDPLVGDLQVQRFYPDQRRDKFIQAALTIEGKIGNFDLTYAGAYLDRKTYQINDYTDYAEAYDALYADYGGLAGYFYLEDNGGNDIDPRQFIIGTDHFRKMSQEVRVSSPQDERFRVVAGLFYQRQSNEIHQDYIVPGLASALSVNGRPGTLWLTEQKRVDKDYAAFGEASFDITPTVTLTGGGRYYKYDNSLIGFFGFGRNPNGPPFNGAGSSRTGVAGCYTTTGAILRDNPGGTLLPAAVPGGPCTNLADFVGGELVPKRTKDTGFTHRVNLTWKASEDVMTYATWSRGFRPGGINRRGTIAPYDADFLTNYELGIKTTLADGKVRLNAAIYMQDWKRFQFSFLGENSFTEIHNGPNARIKGIEADVNIRATDGLTFTAAASYTDAKTRNNLCAIDDPTYQCTDPGNSISAAKGTRLPVTPKFNGNATVRYQFPVGPGEMHFQSVIAHRSSATPDIRVATANALGRIKGSTTVDFGAGFEWSNYSFELFLQNAFDERAQLARFSNCGQCDGRVQVLVNQPRTIGARLGAKF
ncbi:MULTISPECIES: TonB-dependent receptor [unclassified Sphingopyxis]|uniref:TonB-dependent receptor n=1 Tax=unclassified Sphingopyxis TaxID=2614943 RepID=UPI00073673E4|nr:MULTISPECIES: TonB-dependent receptor [unclassified Sphingopyxis]KTE37608.1 TonB-dependent receptor [Sphingopyxis sp. HIX]KTE74928.1 TonB-dependent receptor [Sphingopyxis sp. HXXIV]